MIAIEPIQNLFIKDLMHPLKFAGDLVRDVKELSEDVVDWHKGTLPQDIRIGGKAFSVILRLGGTLAIVGTCTFAAVQIVGLTGVALTVHLLFQSLMFCFVGSLGLELGRQLRKEFVGPSPASNYFHTNTLEIRNNRTETKARLGPREYLYKTVGKTTENKEGVEKTFEYTAYTYVKTTRTLDNPQSGNTQILIEGELVNPPQEDQNLCYISNFHKAFVQLPEVAMRYIFPKG